MGWRAIETRIHAGRSICQFIQSFGKLAVLVKIEHTHILCSKNFISNDILNRNVCECLLKYIYKNVQSSINFNNSRGNKSQISILTGIEKRM